MSIKESRLNALRSLKEVNAQEDQGTIIYPTVEHALAEAKKITKQLQGEADYLAHVLQEGDYQTAAMVREAIGMTVDSLQWRINMLVKGDTEPSERDDLRNAPPM